MSARLPFPHLLLALSVVAVWGTNFVVIHLALQHFPPLMLATLRFMLASLPWLIFLSRPSVPWRELAAYGVLVGLGQFGMLYIAMRGDISPGLASLVVQAQVFFTMGLAAYFFRESIRPLQAAAITVAAAGLLLIAANAEHAATPRGIALTVLAALSWGASNLIVKKAGRVNALSYIVWASLFAIPPLVVLTLLFEGWPSMVQAVKDADGGGWAAVLWQALANTLFGYGVWSWLLARHPATAVAPMAMLVPIFGLGASAVLLGEALPGWKILAAALVIAGLALNLLPGRPRHAAAEVKS
jgi:O-acetylserine/cysteine efflux transporter